MHKLLEYIEKFRQLSEYKINWSKLELLGLTEQTYQALLSQWDFPNNIKTSRYSNSQRFKTNS